MAVPSCLDIPGANDTLVVLKTGSTELQDKLPVHIATTLRCYPNQLVFSDHEEQFQGISILDALEDVDAEFKENHDDFELYRRLQQYGRASLDSSELSGPVSGPSGGSGKPLNPGWRLDKWKFLPMMRKTLQLHPDKRWYIFLETDTSIFWTALLAYLAALDWTKPYYIGNQMQIAADVFAHGGSGYVISRPALEMVVKHYLENKREWENITRDHWAGDCVLGMALKAAGTPLLWAWPIWQGNDIGNMIYNRTDYNRRLWCNPTVSYHHVNPPSIKDLWIFEQRWLSENGKNDSRFLRHKDVFAEYILPRTMQPRSDWDNHGDNEEGSVSSLDACRELCYSNTSCLQYVVDTNSRCFTSSRPNLGQPSPGMESGWAYERMQDFYEKAAPCGDEGWIT